MIIAEYVLIGKSKDKGETVMQHDSGEFIDVPKAASWLQMVQIFVDGAINSGELDGPYTFWTTIDTDEDQ